MKRPSKIVSNTCLAIVRDDKGKLHLAGDRRISWGYHKAQVMVRPKVMKRDGLLLAGTGVSAICTEVVALFPIPEVSPTIDVEIYINEIFIPNLMNFLHDKHYMHPVERRLHYKEELLRHGVEEWFGALILIGIKGQVFELTVDNDVIAADLVDAPTAAGCGGELALGSLLTTEKTKMPAKKRLITALTVAASVSPGCDHNIDIVSE